MNTIKCFIIALTLMGYASDQLIAQTQSSERELAKFERKDGRCLLFVGQELESIGGLEEPYNQGYLDYFDRPAGFTMYSNLTPGEPSFGYTLKGLDGIKFEADWGDSPSHMDRQLADSDFENMCLAIGLSLVNQEADVAIGMRDELIIELGEWIKSIAPRPVFLRIGYEFDGHAWNHYDIDDYKKAYRRIKDMLDQLKLENVCYVWQSTGWVSNMDMLEEWYPGDEYVDWCGVSFFARWDEIKMFEFARAKGKPVFIAEATPVISNHTVKFDGDTKRTILSSDKDARLAWEKWFIPFFDAIQNNSDVVKAVSYINCNWRKHRMWKENPTFRSLDARIQESPFAVVNWKKKLAELQLVHSSDELYDSLKK